MSDYSDYYNGGPRFSPCSNANLKDFAEVFLPTIYSLVFVLGIIGMYAFVTRVSERDRFFTRNIIIWNIKPRLPPSPKATV